MLQFEDLAIRQTGHVCNAWNVWAKLVHFWLAAMLHLDNGDGDKDCDDDDDGVDDDQPEDAEWGRAKPIARWLTRSHCHKIFTIFYHISIFDLCLKIVFESLRYHCRLPIGGWQYYLIIHYSLFVNRPIHEQWMMRPQSCQESWPAGRKEVDDGDDKLLFAKVFSSFSHFYQISVNQVPVMLQSRFFSGQGMTF